MDHQLIPIADQFWETHGFSIAMLVPQGRIPSGCLGSRPRPAMMWEAGLPPPRKLRPWWEKMRMIRYSLTEFHWKSRGNPRFFFKDTLGFSCSIFLDPIARSMEEDGDGGNNDCHWMSRRLSQHPCFFLKHFFESSRVPGFWFNLDSQVHRRLHAIYADSKTGNLHPVISSSLAPNVDQSFLSVRYHVGMDQYLLIPFLVGWTSIYQLFWGSLGTRVLTHPHVSYPPEWWIFGPAGLGMLT